jgi:hypothetical protein
MMVHYDDQGMKKSCDQCSYSIDPNTKALNVNLCEPFNNSETESTSASFPKEIYKDALRKFEETGTANIGKNGQRLKIRRLEKGFYIEINGCSKECNCPESKKRISELIEIANQ